MAKGKTKATATPKPKDSLAGASIHAEAEQQRQQDKRDQWRMKIIKWAELMLRVRDLEVSLLSHVQHGVLDDDDALAAALRAVGELSCRVSDCLPLD